MHLMRTESRREQHAVLAGQWAPRFPAFTASLGLNLNHKSPNCQTLSESKGIGLLRAPMA